MEIKGTILCIDEIIDKLYRDERFAYTKISEIINEIRDEYSAFMTIIPELNKLGMNIDIQLLLVQLQNLSDAIETRNKVKIYDTLGFEIKDTLLLYDEILKEIGGDT